MGGGGSKSAGRKGGAKSKVNQHDRAVLDLKAQRDKLKQYSKRLDLAMQHETEVAREQLAKGNKQNALLCLRKKKYQAGLLEKAEAQLENVQKMVDSVEFAQMEQQVFQNLKEGNEVLKQIHSQMSLDEIDEIMLDTEEAIERQREIDASLTLGLSDMGVDEDDILAEYEALEAAGLDALPDAPTHELPTADKTPAKEAARTKTKQNDAVMLTA